VTVQLGWLMANACAAVTGNAQSPKVDRQTGGTVRVVDMLLTVIVTNHDPVILFLLILFCFVG